MTTYKGGVSHNEQDREEFLSTMWKNKTKDMILAGFSQNSPDKEIKIGGHKFTAIKSTSLSKEATVCKYRVEDGFSIADHIFLNPVSFEYEIELIDEKSEYELLDDLFKKKTPFSLVTYRGTFSNMVISKLSDATTSSTNTTSCTVSIEEIRIAKTDVVEIKNTANVTTSTEENYKGGYTLTVLGKATVAATVPEKTTSQTGVGYCDTLTPSLAASTAFLNRRSS